MQYYPINDSALLETTDRIACNSKAKSTSYRITTCVLQGDNLIHALKQCVQSLETKCFTLLNSLFQALETNLIYCQPEK